MAARLLWLGALVLAAAGCGAETVSSGAAPPESTTARVERVMVVSSGSGTQELRSTEVVDYVRDRSTSVEPVSGCRTVTIGDVSYVEVPRAAGLPEGKRWVRNGGSEVDGEALFVESLQPQTTEDGASVSTLIGFVAEEPPPNDYLDYLREQSGEPERMGEEEVHGVPTTRYRTTLDQRQVMRDQLEDDGWKAVNIERYLEQMVATEEDVEIWVDADGLVRRIVKTTNAQLPLMTHRSVTTIVYFDFGVEQNIVAPPAAEVIDSDEWQRLARARMDEQMEEQRRRFEGGIESLPGAFEPSVAPSCLH